MFFFFFNDTATTEIYTLSLHDALPISEHVADAVARPHRHAAGQRAHGEPGAELAIEAGLQVGRVRPHARPDRESTRLNSSHANISYAVFCLKKKKKKITSKINI